MAAVIQRPLRGSRISTFYPVKSLPSLASLDSAFQLQEYISLLIRLDVHDVEAIVSLPGSSSKDKDSSSVDKEKEESEGAKEGDKDAEKAKSEITVDEACWIYEQLRRLAQDLSHPLITTLQQECTRASCPEMKAGEWLYLCVAHGNDGAMEQCCAIDYILHTVDSATALLNSPRTFPSRLQIPQASHRHFSSLARRLGRIFAHAYFHHREAFEQAEAESSLYARFLALTSKFDLVPAEFLVIPSSHYTHDEAGPSRDQRGGGPTESRQLYPSQQRPEEPQRQSPGVKQILQQQLGVDRSRSPNPPGLTDPSTSGNGGIGENPPTNTRSRLGRSRTDTMVFNDAEASAVADELAAKAKAGELEPDFEAEIPKTAKPAADVGKAKEEQEGDENDTKFEISLSPDEEIPGIFDEETVEVPTLEEKLALDALAEPMPGLPRLDSPPAPEPPVTEAVLPAKPEGPATPSSPDVKVIDFAAPKPELMEPVNNTPAPSTAAEPSPPADPQPEAKTPAEEVKRASEPAVLSSVTVPAVEETQPSPEVDAAATAATTSHTEVATPATSSAEVALASVEPTSTPASVDQVDAPAVTEALKEDASIGASTTTATSDEPAPNVDDSTVAKTEEDEVKAPVEAPKDVVLAEAAPAPAPAATEASQPAAEKKEADASQLPPAV
ncbi:unnamed protein product [Cyclocybe aegerita]|uniref:Mob1/phocein n=1 Tax=Cyclocybe aegerita TaxID=1973307 RepID=A0A8S0X6K2_CYCAE|nr:unnamed protein product [Cyclocybe aegerita]